MLITTDTARAANRNFRAIYYSDLARAAAQLTWWRQLFMVIQSDSPEETVSFLRGTPRMREWLGDRKIKSMAEVSYKITKKDWEGTISVQRDYILYDRLNLVRPGIAAFAASFPLHYVDMSVDLMLGGFTTNGYDNQFFFDVDHDNGAGALYSNLTANAFSAAEWLIAKTRPASLRERDSQRYLGVRYDTIFYAPNAEAAVDTVFGTPILAGGGTNIYYNNIQPANRIVLPELGNTAKWFVADLSKPVKPFLLLINKGVDFIALDNAHDWTVFNAKEYIFGIDSIDNAGYGLWELMYGSSVA